jgi:hypothetical protein
VTNGSEKRPNGYRVRTAIDTRASELVQKIDAFFAFRTEIPQAGEIREDSVEW